MAALGTGCVILAEADVENEDYLRTILEFMDCAPLLERRPEAIAEAVGEDPTGWSALFVGASLPADEKDALIRFAAGHKPRIPVFVVYRGEAPAVGSDVLGTLALPTRYDTVLSLLHRGQSTPSSAVARSRVARSSCSARCPGPAGRRGGSRR